MRKFWGLLCTSVLFFGVSTNVFADGVEDGTYVDAGDGFLGENEPDSLFKEYARAFTCDSGSSWTAYPWTESAGYTWIQSTASKGYIKDADKYGPVLGVILNDTKIDFSDGGYTVKIRYDGGNNRNYVIGIQSTLKCLDYNVGTIDGVYGPGTESAVKAFQTNRGLTSDGIVGKQTYYELSRASY